GPVAYVGSALVLLALGRFGALVLRIARTRRIEPEGPLLHLVVGAAFLAQGAVLGLALLAGAAPQHRAVAAYVLLLLLGWAAGVTVGHLPKLLSLSIWVWWPPGPRPKQDAIYPRRLAQLESALFAAAVGVYVGSATAALVGAALLLAAALLATAAAAVVWRGRARPCGGADAVAPSPSRTANRAESPHLTSGDTWES